MTDKSDTTEQDAVLAGAKFYTVPNWERIIFWKDGRMVEELT